MCSTEPTPRDKVNSNSIKVVSVNKPTKEEGSKKTKELSGFLSKTWHMPISSE